MLWGILPIEFGEVSILRIEFFIDHYLDVEDLCIDYRPGTVIGLILRVIFELSAWKETPFDTFAIAKLKWNVTSVFPRDSNRESAASILAATTARESILSKAQPGI
jgi:hypothetical protein